MVSDLIERVKGLFGHLLWEGDLSRLPWWQAMPRRLFRFFGVIYLDLQEGHLTLWAMSLVYTTLLSLVPLIAVSFSVLKAFGAHNQVEPMLLQFLAPMGEQGVEITGRIIGFVENIKAGVLGSLGLALLFYTVISLIQKAEQAFNAIWRVKQSRPFSQRFSDYLSVIMIGPVLIFSALGVTATVMNSAIIRGIAEIEPFGALIHLGARIVPYILVISAFTFVYIFVPNTTVKFKPALLGGVVAGVMWETIGWVFASFVVNSSQYAAIYSTFAGLIMFMIWLYLSWVILFLGASIAFYNQYPGYLAVSRRQMRLSPRLRERLALMIMAEVGRRHYAGEAQLTLESLARHFQIPLEITEFMLGILRRGSFLMGSDEVPPRYLPGRPLDETLVVDLLAAVRSSEEGQLLHPGRLSAQPQVIRVVEGTEEALRQAVGGLTIKDLSRPRFADVGTSTGGGQEGTP